MTLKKALAGGLLHGLGLLSHAVPGAAVAAIVHFMTSPRRGHRWEGVADAQWRTPSGLQVHAWGAVGPLVLCLHGWESSGLQFCGLASHLKTRGFRVWAVDAFAHGQSPGRKATPLDLFHSLREVRAMATEPVSVVGHSIGAAMVMLAMREGLTFSRRVLISGPISFDDTYAKFNESIGLSSRTYEGLVRKFETYTGRSIDCLNMLATPPGGSALLVHDRQDTEVPIESAISLARAWPQAELWITEGLGHRRILRDPVVWERIGSYIEEGSSIQTSPERSGHSNPGRHAEIVSVPIPSPLY